MKNELQLTQVGERLKTVAPHFGLTAEQVSNLLLRGVGPLLFELALRAKRDSGTELTWLLLTGLTACFPTSPELLRVRRQLLQSRDALAYRAFLEAGVRNSIGFTLPNARVEVLTNAVVADVNFCAKNSHNTGIQRVVRHTMARWSATTDVVPVAWTDGAEAMRLLDPVEAQRVIDYPRSESPERAKKSENSHLTLVIPFRSVVAILEVPAAEHCGPLLALAEYSGNRVAVLGYDTIPVVSANTVPLSESNRFVSYLSVVKKSARLVGISAAAAEEFAGFVYALTAQGITGPSTFAVSLPVDVPDLADTGTPTLESAPLVLIVGSHEPRKNHEAILFAAETLWREGLQFSLQFIGGGSHTHTRQFDKRVKKLIRASRPIEILRGASDTLLLESYRRAAFTVFPSLHEGYGLPVAESLALGVPAVTTNYGSTAEIAADGGCLLVDPRDDDSLIAAMRSLLADPSLLEELREQIRHRPSRNWNDYAEELWLALIEPVRQDLS